MAIALRALADSIPQQHLLSATGHFLSVPDFGPATVDVEEVRVGRKVARGEAHLVQGDREHLRVITAFGASRAADDGLRPESGALPPEIPPPPECTPFPATTPDGREAPVRDKLEIRYHPESVGWSRGVPSGFAEVRAWMRLSDGSSQSPMLLPLLLDVLPSSVFDLGVVGWVPTLELTIHQFAPATDGWLLCATRMTVAEGGFFEEDGEVWDEQGGLIATSRQLALFPREG